MKRLRARRRQGMRRSAARLPTREWKRRSARGLRGFSLARAAQVYASRHRESLGGRSTLAKASLVPGRAHGHHGV